MRERLCFSFINTSHISVDNLSMNGKKGRMVRRCDFSFDILYTNRTTLDAIPDILSVRVCASVHCTHMHILFDRV